MEKRTPTIPAETKKEDALHAEVRSYVYAHFQNKNERQIDSIWEECLCRPKTTLQNSSIKYEQSDKGIVVKATVDEVLQKFPAEAYEWNACVQELKAEFENDRKKQIEEFQEIVLTALHHWISSYNVGNYTEANELRDHLIAYVEKSTEPIVFPMAVEKDERYPGLVATEAIKIASKLTMIDQWVQEDTEKKLLMKPLIWFSELYNLVKREDLWQKPTVELQELKLPHEVLAA